MVKAKTTYTITDAMRSEAEIQMHEGMHFGTCIVIKKFLD